MLDYLVTVKFIAVWRVSAVCGHWCSLQYKNITTAMWCAHANAITTMRCHHWWLEPMKFTFPVGNRALQLMRCT